MLIETNYITNPRAAMELLTPDYQQSLAKAIMTGVSGYFDRYPPVGTAMAALRAQQRANTAGAVVAATGISNRR